MDPMLRRRYRPTALLVERICSVSHGQAGEKEIERSPLREVLIRIPAETEGGAQGVCCEWAVYCTFCAVYCSIYNIGFIRWGGGARRETLLLLYIMYSKYVYTLYNQYTAVCSVV